MNNKIKMKLIDKWLSQESKKQEWKIYE